MPTSARSPLRVGITELRRRPGTQRDVTATVTIDDLAVTSARVPADASIAVDATLEAIEGGISVRGSVRVPWTAECRRCLDEVHGELEVELQEVFEPNPSDGDTYPIDGDEVDLEPIVRDAALLNLPLAPLCRDDCAGPAPEAFPARVEGDDEPGDDEPAGDPRWAVLDQLKDDPGS